MARPRKHVSEHRTETVKINLTMEEKADLLTKAEAAAKSPAVYARETVLHSRTVRVRGRGLDARTYDTLNRLGVNLNQLARAFNTGLDVNHHLLNETLERINRELDEGLA